MATAIVARNPVSKANGAAPGEVRWDAGGRLSGLPRGVKNSALEKSLEVHGATRAIARPFAVH
jgi:hypothetical protein